MEDMPEDWIDRDRADGHTPLSLLWSSFDPWDEKGEFIERFAEITGSATVYLIRGGANPYWVPQNGKSAAESMVDYKKKGGRVLGMPEQLYGHIEAEWSARQLSETTASAQGNAARRL